MCSMISEQVKELRRYSELCLQYCNEKRAKELLSEAADTIETLSAKLRVTEIELSEMMERLLLKIHGGKWIACEDRLPEDMEDVLVFYKARIDGGTHDGEEIHNFGIGYYSSHSNKWSIVTLVKTKSDTHKVIAWQPLPEPYRP